MRPTAALTEEAREHADGADESRLSPADGLELTKLATERDPGFALLGRYDVKRGEPDLFGMEE